MSSKQILGFDSKTGRPATWPLPYSIVSWSASIKGLTPGKYEVRALVVDLNDYAQPEPRPIQKTGKNAIQCGASRWCDLPSGLENATPAD